MEYHDPRVPLVMFRDWRLPVREFKLMCILLEYTDPENGVCTCAVPNGELAKRGGWSVRTVQRALLRAEELGYVRVRYEPTPNNGSDGASPKRVIEVTLPYTGDELNQAPEGFESRSREGGLE